MILKLICELRSIGDLGLDRGAYKVLLEAKQPPAEPFSYVLLITLHDHTVK